jgi:hypothetical protein
MRHVVDRKLFEQFQEKVVKSIKPFVPDPIVKDLWPEVLEADEMLTRSQRRTVLAHSIAAGRHRVEHSVGLKTLEVPISHLAGSFSFAKFSRYLLEHLGGFREIYNAAISRYRAKHGIRSSAHPVPELGHLQEGGNLWLEAPFWIWTDQTPFRKPLFVRRVAGNIELSNSQTTLARIALAEWDDWLVKQNQQIQTTGRGIFIRPRALITTMYARLLASDLFVHGIGGAKYDQLTDQIIQDFFGVAPPRFVTATGTWALPTEFPKISPADITTGKETLRRMRFHPETFITSADKNTAALIAAKHAAIANQSQQTASQRHQAIESANLKLQAMLHLHRKAVSTEIDLLSSQLRDSQILNSREFSFALHPIELIERLNK